MPMDAVERASDGLPPIPPRLALVGCSLTEGGIELRHPSFWRCLRSGRASGVHETQLACK